MLVFLCFLVIGSVLVFLILQFDKKQRVRINKIIKDTKHVQPLFMLRSAEEKLATLNNLLLNNTLNIDEAARQLLAAQLNELNKSYEKGDIDIKAYHTRLNEMIIAVKEVKELKFEHIKRR